MKTLKSTCLALSIAALAPAMAETLFVTAEKSALLSAPKANASSLKSLPRATAVAVHKKEGLWVEVSAGSARGFVSRLHLSPNAPIGKAALLKDIEKPSDEKLSRRRPAGNSDSVASTRGLSADSFLARKRGGTDFYQRDIEEIQLLEKYAIAADELSKFSKSANLTP